MSETTVMMGRVLRASTTGFTIGCQQSMAAAGAEHPALRLAGASGEP